MTRAWQWIRPSLGFFCAWALLDCVVNLRYPGNEPYPWYLLPSIDIVVLFAVMVALGWRGLRLPTQVRAVLVVLVIATRVVRFAEGLVERHFHRPLSLYLDTPLVPELFRLLRATVSLPRLVLGAFAFLSLLAGLAVVTWRTLAYLERSLATTPPRILLLATVAAGSLLSPLWPQRDDPHLHLGLFGRSALTQYAREVVFLFNAGSYRRQKEEVIANVDRQLRLTGPALDRLHGADVLLFFVESYGEAVIAQPEYARRIGPMYETMEATLVEHGFTIASSLLESPTFGGNSWLAHATLATGVRAQNGLDYALLLRHRPPPLTMANLFQSAGYRTVLAEPGTTRPNPEGVVQGFDRKYYANDLAYRGPTFKWATMPDQYVVDYIHRREIAVSHRMPLFVQFVLVSSHAPWSEQPRLLPDWTQLADGGALFNRTEPVRYPIAWSNLEEGGDAYVSSILYDLEVLRRYLVERMQGNALVIVLGDHQPSADITAEGATASVPIHIMSRDRSLVDRFVAAGYTPGILPQRSQSARGMESFLFSLIELLSIPTPTPPGASLEEDVHRRAILTASPVPSRRCTEATNV